MNGATESLRGRAVYLAGPMRGYPRYNFDAFELGAAELRRRGIDVVSPAEMDLALGFDPDRTLEEQGFDVDDALRRDFEAIATVDAVVFLRGAQHSSGCLAEFEVAQALDLPTYSLERCYVDPRRWCLRAWSRRATARMLRSRTRASLMAVALATLAVLGMGAATTDDSPDAVAASVTVVANLPDGADDPVDVVDDAVDDVLDVLPGKRLAA